MAPEPDPAPVPAAAPEQAPGNSRAAELLQRINSVERVVTESRDTVQSASSRDDFDRSLIARIIMLVYAGVLVLEFILYAVRAWHAKDDTAAWDKIALDAGDLMKTAVLPIVTLVLGYYFGKSGRA